jgi:hypothetical protein
VWVSLGVDANFEAISPVWCQILGFVNVTTVIVMFGAPFTIIWIQYIFVTSGVEKVFPHSKN